MTNLIDRLCVCLVSLVTTNRTASRTYIYCNLSACVKIEVTLSENIKKLYVINGFKYQTEKLSGNIELWIIRTKEK